MKRTNRAYEKASILRFRRTKSGKIKTENVIEGTKAEIESIFAIVAQYPDETPLERIIKDLTPPRLFVAPKGRIFKDLKILIENGYCTAGQVKSMRQVIYRIVDDKLQPYISPPLVK